ncbi:MAG: outer membrane beta-barrel protein [Lentimicrobium sp.]
MNLVWDKFLKLFVVAVILVIVAPQASAQRMKVRNLTNYDLAPYHFGFILGMNDMLFTIKTKPGFQDLVFYNYQGEPGSVVPDSVRLYGIQHKPYLGFTIGIVSNLRINDYFDFRFIPSLSFGERDMEYSILSYYNGEASQRKITEKTQSTFVEFPFHLKYKGSRLNNVRPYWLVGGKYAIDLASDSGKNSGNTIVLMQNDVYGEMGAGLDFYTTFFKFGIELKMSYGMRDMLKRKANVYTYPVERLSSKMFLISFTFE